MQLTKRMALALALCLMMSMMTAALTEATEAMPELTEAAAPEAAEALPEAAPETVEPTPEAAEAAPVEGASGDAEGEVSLDAIMDEAAPATEAEAPEANAQADETVIEYQPEAQTVVEEAPNAAPPEAAPEGPRYAVVISESAPVYIRATDWDITAILSAGDVLLATGVEGGRAAVAYNVAGSVAAGFMEQADLAAMDEAQVAAYMSAAATGTVALYNDDINLPLSRLEGAIWGEDLAVMANYSEYGNDTVYTLNGVQVSANMVPDPGSGRCWTYAQGIYQLAWGCKFSENFKGDAATGYNLLRDLNDAQRKLTPAHLKAFILRTTPGATIRIGGCTSDCGSFNNDGLGCGHSGHSLIVVDHNDEGVVTMDSHSNSQHTRFYSWKGFCAAWSGYPYVKYIKWPNAPAIPSNEIAEDGSAEIPVTGIALSQAELTVAIGATATLTAEVTPADATQKGVTWASSDPAVATVADGVVTGVKEGTVTVGAKTIDGDKLATCTVTVKKPVTQKALSKTGGNGTVTLGIGEQMQLSADFATAKGWQLAGVKSAKPGVASVDGTGLVTAVAEGKAKITVATTNKKKATLTVKVVDANKPTAIAITQGKTGTLGMGSTLQLTTSLTPKTAKVALTWVSSKPKVATVDANGLVTPVSEGTVKIGVATPNKKKAVITLKVVNPNAPDRVALNRSGTVALKVGETLKLEAAVLPETATTTYAWKSSKPKVASVDANGNVTALKKGSCTIAVKTSNGKLAKVKIKVS